MSKDKAIEPRLVEINREPVELYKVLKFEGLTGSGGEAKAAIDSGLVTVNGNVELQRRKKLVGGDVIRVGDEVLVLGLIEGYVAPEESESETLAQSAKTATSSKSAESAESAESAKSAKKAPPKKDWRRKRTPAQIDADAGVVSERGKLDIQASGKAKPRAGGRPTSRGRRG